MDEFLLASRYRNGKFTQELTHRRPFRFEPPNNILEKYSHRRRGHFSAEYWNSMYPKISKAKVITAIEMFYYLDDPNSFCKDVHDIIDEDGIFVIQMNDLDSMIQNYSIDNICFSPTTYIRGPCMPISDIKNGDEVTSYDGDKVRVVKTMKREYKGELCEINAKYLEKITCSPEHPILIAKKDWFRFPNSNTIATIPMILNTKLKVFIIL